MAGQIYIQYTKRFKQKAPQYKAGPVENRSCNDICCLVTFFLIFLLTVGGGIYFIAQGRQTFEKIIVSTDVQDAKQFAAILGRIAPVMVGMMVLSSCLSIIYIFLAKTFPKCLTYSMIVFTFLIYIAMIVLGIIIQNYALAAVFGVILVINALVLWCCWDYITIGIKLLEVAGSFITEKPAVYFISLICLVLNILYTVFWVFSWVGVSSTGVVNNSDTFRILSYVWIADGVFFCYFLYYNMVFLIAMACAFWYYQNPENSVMKGFNYLKYQIGSITFASIVITVITIMRMLASNENSQNGIVRVLACIMSCILRCIEELVKVLNHNSVIVMAVSGQGYIDSAKSAVGLIFDNFGLFIIVDFFTQFMEVYATIICVILPTIIGSIIIYLTSTGDADLALNDAIWGGVVILLLAALISSVVLGMLSQVLSCIFIFYCFDSQLTSMGIEVNNIPHQIKSVMDQANGSPTVQQASLAYLK